MINKTIGLILILFYLLPGLLKAQTEPVQKYSQVKIFIESEKTIQFLQELGIDLICGAHHNHKDETLELVLSSYELGQLNSKPLRYEIIVEDLAKQTEERLKKKLPKAQSDLNKLKSKKKNNPGQDSGCSLPEYLVPQNFQLGSMGGFTSYNELLDILDEMKSLYPNLISTKQSISETQTTIEGRPIYFVRISDNPEIDEEEPEVLYDGIHHSREPVSMMSILYYMWYLLENYADDPEVKNLVDNMELYFVPMINPDGYLYNESTNPNGGGLWRKNRRNNGNGTFGVDINRNYGFNWGIDDTGSSSNPGSNTYRGTEAFSEPETQMMRDFILAHDFKVAINNHVYSEYLLHSWGTEDVLPSPDNVLFQSMGEHMTRHNRYYYGQTHFVIYDVNGDANDWAYGEQTVKEKIYGFTPEVGLQSEGGFWPDPDLIVSQCQEQIHTFFASAYFSMNYAILHDNGSLNIDANDPELKFMLEQISAVDGSFTINITALTDNVESIENPILSSSVLTANAYEELSTSFAVTDDIEPGDLIQFEITLNNGIFDIHTETISKYYSSVNIIDETADNNGTSNWTGDWVLDPNEAYTGTTSFTESIGTNTPGEKIFQYSDPIDLSEANFAFLEYYMKYDIQHQFDFVALEVSTNGLTWNAVCGLHSKPGSDDFVTGHPPSAQPENSPLYDAHKADWVREQVDLSGYLGEPSLYLRFFSFTSNVYENKEGFFFDDFKLIRNPLSHCEDGIVNADETGTDCGGLDCNPCPSCDDGILNGLETDIDCGGPNCVECPFDPCPAINFDEYELLSYADQDFGFGDYFENGNGLKVEDNGWKAIELNYTITANTVISFDFKSTEEGEIHEFLVDTDLLLGGTSERFKLYGTQSTTGLNTDFTYSGSGNYESFTIPIGSYTTGNYNYIAYTADNDLDPNFGNSFFKNFRIFEDEDNNLICDGAVSDLTCSFTLLPGLSNGTSTLSHIIEIQELIGLSTLEPITVILPKDERMTFIYQNNMSELGPFNLDNNVWDYDGNDPSFHIWTSNSEIQGSAVSSFGFEAVYDPQETTGQTAYTISIIAGSGGEVYSSNNIDAETLSYFSE